MTRFMMTLLVGSMMGAPGMAGEPMGPTQPTRAVADRPLDAEVEETLVLFDFEQHDRMTTSVSLDGRSNLNFMIDTGAERSAIAAEVASELGLRQSGEKRVISFAGSTNVPTVEARGVGMTAADIRPMELLTFSRRAIGADGVLGIDSLQNKTVIFNFGNQEMRIRESGAKRRAGNREVAVGLEERGGRMVISNAKVDDLEVDMIIDTGSAVSIGNIALRDALRRRGRLNDLTEGVILTFTGQLVRAEVGIVRNVDVDGFTIERMPVAFVHSSSFTYLGYATEPVLYFGMEAMRAFDSMEVDFANKQALFKARDVPGFNSRSTWFIEAQDRRNRERSQAVRRTSAAQN